MCEFAEMIGRSTMAEFTSPPENDELVPAGPEVDLRLDTTLQLSHLRNSARPSSDVSGHLTEPGERGAKQRASSAKQKTSPADRVAVAV